MSSDATSDAKFPKSPRIVEKEYKKKARRFFLTINDVSTYEEVKKNIQSRRTFRYLVAGKEIAPETGHEHIHMYVEFTNTIQLTTKTCCGAHIEPAIKKDQCIDYCTKDCEVIDEIGQPTHQGSKTVKELIEMKDPTSLDPRLFKTWQNVQMWDQSRKASDWYCPDKQVTWIWGDSGAGKTKRAIQLVGDNMVDRVKYVNGFWNGVSYNEDVKWCIYDDFRDSHMHPSELISFCDYYRNQMNVKGGNVVNHYDHIIITSVQDPHEIYPNMKDDEPKQQWLRRMNIIHMNKLSN